MILKNQRILNQCHAGHDQSQSGAASGGQPSEYELKHAQEDYENL